MFLPVARWFRSTTCSGPDRCWINEFEVAQIVRSPPQKKKKKKKKNTLTESRMECVLVRGNTNTHSTSLAGSAALGRCQRDVHLFLMFPSMEQKPSLFGACHGLFGHRWMARSPNTY